MKKSISSTNGAYCVDNRLSINIIKTFYLLFTNKDTSSLPPLTIKNNYSYDVIKRVSHTKFLGVIYDDKLTFSHHINMLCNKLARSSALLFQLSDFLPIYILKRLYYAHILPHLNYCNAIWCNTYQTHRTPLILIHKRIIRNIAKAEFLAHTEPLYKNLNILNIDNIRKMNLALLIYKQTKFNEYDFNLETPDHTYNTRQRNDLVIPQHRTTLISNSFLIQSIRLWNQIPQHFKTSLTIPSFKTKMLTFLLQ